MGNKTERYFLIPKEDYEYLAIGDGYATLEDADEVLASNDGYFEEGYMVIKGRLLLTITTGGQRIDPQDA